MAGSSFCRGLGPPKSDLALQNGDTQPPQVIFWGYRKPIPMFVRLSQLFLRFYPQFDGEMIPFHAVKGCGTCVKSRALCPAYHQSTRGEFMGGVDQSEMENKAVTRPEASGLACPIFCGNQAFEPNLKSMLAMILQKSGFMWYVRCLLV